MLLHGINKLLEGVSDKLEVLQSRELTLLDACVHREEPCLVDLLRLNQSVDPMLLSLLESFDHLSLVKQVFLVLAEVLCTDIFDLAKLLVVNLLECVSVGLGLCCDF